MSKTHVPLTVREGRKTLRSEMCQNRWRKKLL